MSTQVEIDRLRAAFFLIGTTCERYTAGSCIEHRNPFASYGADKCCHGCVAASALGLDPDRSKRDDTLNLADQIRKYPPS